MAITGTLLQIIGGLCLFLYGMKLMSEGIQQAAGRRIQKILNLMSGNRFTAVIAGSALAALIQSSSAVMAVTVSFVNAGLLSLAQAIGVILGANIGTTLTVWFVSLVGFYLNLAGLVLPAVGVGFIFRIIKWKHQGLGEAVLGFGLLFMGMDFLAGSVPDLSGSLNAITAVSNLGFVSYLIGAGAGLVIGLLVRSSTAAIVIMLLLAFNGIAGYEMAAAMILGANVGVTIDAVLAATGTKIAARRAALVHVLFNVIGVFWALPLLKPLLMLTSLAAPGVLVPGAIGDPQVPVHLAMLYTVFNLANTILCLPFIKPLEKLVSLVIKDDKYEAAVALHYRLVHHTGAIQSTPEFSILRAEKEIRDMGGLVSSMYGDFSAVLKTLRETGNRQEALDSLCFESKRKKEYAGEMREFLAGFLMDCAGEQPRPCSGRQIAQLLRVISNLDDMAGGCYRISMLLERGVRKEHSIKGKETAALIPYINTVEDFFTLVLENLSNPLPEKIWEVREQKTAIDRAAKKLYKLGRKRLEAGKDVKTELLFIELVRNIERLADCSYDIAAAVMK